MQVNYCFFVTKFQKTPKHDMSLKFMLFLKPKRRFILRRKIPAENLLKLSFGYSVVALSGLYYQRTEAIGTMFTNALSDGAIKVFGQICMLILPMIPT
jgi:hypothetical protein